jgi:hypothetical protein
MTLEENSWRCRRMGMPLEGSKSPEEAVWMERWMEEVEVKDQATDHFTLGRN